MERRLALLKQTDPENIYVENIRSFFNMPFKVARFFCELAVKEQVFEKKIGYLCPNGGNIIFYLQPGSHLPRNIICNTCLAEDNPRYEFDPATLSTIDVYKVAGPIEPQEIDEEGSAVAN